MRNNLKMLLEELLPFYFLLMVFAIIFTSYVPTTFELYIVYAFCFGVMVFNNRLYKTNMDLQNWRDEALEIVEELEKENNILRKMAKRRVDKWQ